MNSNATTEPLTPIAPMRLSRIDVLNRRYSEVGPLPTPRQIPACNEQLSIAELSKLLAHSTTPGDYDRALQLAGVRILQSLEHEPGDGWQEKWDSFVARCPAERNSWRIDLGLEVGSNSYQRAIGGWRLLVQSEAFRPTYDWVLREAVPLPTNFQLLEAWNGGDVERFNDAIRDQSLTTRYEALVRRTLIRISIVTGLRLRELEPNDLIAYHLVRHQNGMNSQTGLQIIWRALRSLGWLHHPDENMPMPTRRLPRETPTQIVDRYGIPSPQREVFIRDLELRSASISHGTLRTLSSRLLGVFWKEILLRQPNTSDFRIPSDVIADWKLWLRATRKKRGDYHGVLFCVRAFYLDIQQWAIEDPAEWSRWVATCPIRRAEVAGYGNSRRRQVASLHQRTRELSNYVPQLISEAFAEKERTRKLLDELKAHEVGQDIDYGGLTWEVIQNDRNAPLRLRNSDGALVDPVRLEQHAFWTWAIVEILRHSGIRHEEMLELTHFSVQSQKLPGAEELVPLLHIPPTKTDFERLIVAGPELMHALSEVVRRVRTPSGFLPLTRRWDGQDRNLGSPKPHLMILQNHRRLEVMSPPTVRKLLREISTRIGVVVDGSPDVFTPHDFRRLFATDALATGLPPHIVQALMGHQNLATTQGYAAIYPSDVIRHHQSFIERRRQLRPAMEYRSPTPEEWDQLEDHFVQRRLSLGSCARAWQTACPHEHACVRCALLRPDPSQRGRLVDIMNNLGLRIREAQENGWQGEVEGLQTTLAAAQRKLESMDGELSAIRDLGMPEVPRK